MTHAASVVASTAMSMDITHYMELLATNQPWNLLIFMAIPVILAETLTAGKRRKYAAIVGWSLIGITLLTRCRNT